MNNQIKFIADTYKYIYIYIYIYILAWCFNYALNHANSFTQYTHLKLNNTIFYILPINIDGSLRNQQVDESRIPIALKLDPESR